MPGSRNAGRLRPSDLAREHHLSTQAVRNYEADGILPPADRTPHGYRVYTSVHAQALRAFLALVPGHGHRTAADIMRAVNEGVEGDAFRLIDEGHVQLSNDRKTYDAVKDALVHVDSGSPSGGSVFIGPLAHRLGVKAATLRRWEMAGLIRPRRDRQTGYRVYSAADVRDAELTHQLRRGGFPLERIVPVIEEIRTAGGVEQVAGLLGIWQDRLTGRARSMIEGATELDGYLRMRG